jgi:hypothetical protein
MAQLIHCDATDCPELAAVMITRIENGETMAWCDPHFVAMAQAITESIAGAEAEATDAEALARLEAAAPPDAFPMSPESSDAGTADPEPPGRPARGRARTAVDIDATPDPDAAPGPSWTGTEDPDGSDD